MQVFDHPLEPVAVTTEQPGWMMVMLQVTFKNCMYIIYIYICLKNYLTLMQSMGTLDNIQAVRSI